MLEHNVNKGLTYNMVHDASMLYWSARVIELNPATSDKDKVLDKLIIQRLRRLAEELMEGAIHRAKVDMKIPAVENELMEQLLGQKND